MKWIFLYYFGTTGPYHEGVFRMKDLLSGNEAIARGAFEANVWVAAGYPGTPSSEIIQTLSEQYPEIDSEWSINEKVALEVALGASIAGVRSIATMKHVGLNVASDPLMTASYTGVRSGLTVVVADDPGMHSSQNEQDSRHWVKFGRLPLLEPSDSREALDYTKLSLDLSEQYDTPVILRAVTRVSHTKTVVNLSEAKRRLPPYSYRKDPAKFVMVPANAIPRHRAVLERWEKLKTASEKFKGHKIEHRGTSVGIVTHGMIYHYVREALPDASVFSVGMYPVPVQAIRKFASRVSRLFVVEELDPVIEDELRANSLKLTGKELFPEAGELSVELIRNAFAKPKKNAARKTSGAAKTVAAAQPAPLPGRPPVLCKGCGHIPVFEVLRDLDATVLGDIGCYTLGALAPYNAMDTTICMGASVGNEIGFKKLGQLHGQLPRSVAVIGDSTFYHSGMTNLLDAVSNKIPITLVILDNRITAMTGHQTNPGTCLNSKLCAAGEVDLEALCRGLGVKRVRTVNAYQKEDVRRAVLEEWDAAEPSVIIAREICVVSESRMKQIRDRLKAAGDSSPGPTGGAS